MTEAEAVTPPERGEYERTIRALADDNERLTALLKETRSHVLDAGAVGLVADIDRALRLPSGVVCPDCGQRHPLNMCMARRPEPKP